MIDCNQIEQEINRLKIAFSNCKSIKNSDLESLVELIAAVNLCGNGGANYNTKITEVFEPDEDLLVTYPINTYHSIAIAIGVGSIEYNGFTFPSGTSTYEEVTTLNQTPYVFTVKAGSKVLVEYLIETI